MSTALGGTLFLAMPAPGRAQSAQDGGQEAAIEEIIVTAQKREQSLQRVPLAVTVLDAGYIDRAQIVSLDDVVLRAPNVSFFSENPNSKAPAIRGASTQDDSAASDQPVAIFIDEVYTGRLGELDPDLFDVERIEILRGPQGTLFGRNVMGGAINVITKRPHAEPEATIKVGTGRFNRVDVSAYANAPLVEDRLFAKVAISSRNRDGYTRNRVTGNKLDAVDISSIRSQVLYVANENTEILIGGDYTRDRSLGASRDVFGDQPPTLVSLSTNPREADLNLESRYDRDSWGVMGRMDFTTDHGVVTSLSSFRKSSSIFDFDFDATPEPYLNSTQGVRVKQFTQELRMASPDDQRLTWVAGLYYLWSRHSRLEFFDINPDPDTILAFVESLVGDPMDLNRDITSEQSVKTGSFAVFGQATYDVADRIRLTAGGRFTTEKKSGTLVKAGDTEFVFAPLGPFSAEFGKRWSAFTPKVAVEADVTDDVMAYASVARGFKSGAFSQSSPVDAEQAAAPLAPEYVWSYEGGVKSQWFENRFLLNLTYFHADYKDLQIAFFITNPDGSLAPLSQNAGNSSIDGIEVEFAWRPVQSLNIFGSYGYADGQYDKFVTSDGDFSGNRLALTPKHTLNIGATLSRQLSNGGTMTLSADLQHRSGIFFFPDQQAAAAFNASKWNSILNGQITYRTPNGRWEASLWAKNLTNEVVVINAVATTAIANLSLSRGEFGVLNNLGVEYNPPRMWGVSLTARF